MLCCTRIVNRWPLIFPSNTIMTNFEPFANTQSNLPVSCMSNSSNVLQFPAPFSSNHSHQNMGNGALTPPEDLNDDLKDRSNIALIFIKPHCAGIEKVRNFVKSQIEAKGLTILAEKGMSAEDIEEKGCIDKHYASIAKSAMETLPGDISPPDDKKEVSDGMSGVGVGGWGVGGRGGVGV